MNDKGTFNLLYNFEIVRKLYNLFLDLSTNTFTKHIGLKKFLKVVCMPDGLHLTNYRRLIVYRRRYRAATRN